MLNIIGLVADATTHLSFQYNTRVGNVILLPANRSGDFLGFFNYLFYFYFLLSSFQSTDRMNDVCVNRAF